MRPQLHDAILADAAKSRARRFYRHAGFIPVEKGNGSDNDGNLPDIACVWSKEAVA